MDGIVALLILILAPFAGWLLSRAEAEQFSTRAHATELKPQPVKAKRTESTAASQPGFWSDSETRRMLLDKGLLALLILIVGIFLQLAVGKATEELKSALAEKTELHKEQRAAFADLAKEMSAFYEDAENATNYAYSRDKKGDSHFDADATERRLERLKAQLAEVRRAQIAFELLHDPRSHAMDHEVERLRDDYKSVSKAIDDLLHNFALEEQLKHSSDLQVRADLNERGWTLIRTIDDIREKLELHAGAMMREIERIAGQSDLTPAASPR